MRETNVPTNAGRVLDAYRSTQSEVRGALGQDEAQWVRVGALLENASLLPAENRRPHLDAVVESVRATLGPERWAQGHRMDPVRPAKDRSFEGRFRTYCEIVEDAGALALADAMLSAYVNADPDIDTLERARVEAVRARLAWKAGELDVASERYRRVAQMARRERSDELRVRVWAGEAIVARLRGNYPRSRERAQRAAALAERLGMYRLAAVSYQTLMVPAAKASDFGAALVYGWRAYLHALGDPIMEAETLSNLGQLFLDTGHPAPAAAAFRVVIARAQSDRVLIPALGGLAMAAARSADLKLVGWVQREIATRTHAGATPYVIASAQLDLARAWGELQVPRRAESARREALAIALEHRFHEIAHLAETPVLAAIPIRQNLPASAEEVAHSVLHLVGA
jgi:tetratricopeptide (TPR) repeat protein